MLLTPTAPMVAYRLGENAGDPLAVYLGDVDTVLANLAGVPAVSVPAGTAEDGLPCGVQFLAPALEDARLLRVMGGARGGRRRGVRSGRPSPLARADTTPIRWGRMRYCTRMTTTAWGVGLKNALIVTAGLLAVCGVLAATIALVADRTFSSSFGLAFDLFWIGSLVLFAFFWLRGRRVGGRVLLDCGPRPLRWLFLLNAATGVFLAWEGASAEVPVLPGGLRYVLLAAFWIFMAFGRLQFRENGIWAYDGLLRWSNVVTYHAADDGTLVLRTRGFWSFLRSALQVPPEQREAVEKLLLEHAPHAHST